MERYENLELEIIEFERDDVIVTSVLGPIMPAMLDEDTLFSDMWNEEDE